MGQNIVRFFFGAHRSENDALAMRHDFLWATVYCPEGTGHNDVNRDMHRYLTYGALPAKEAFRLLPGAGVPFDLTQFSMIEGSGKRIELVDVPHGLPVTETLEEAADEIRRFAYQDVPYAQAAAYAQDAIAAFVAANRERERHIVGELLRLDGELSGENILVRLGMVHWKIAGCAATSGLRVEHRFQRRHFGMLSLCYHYHNIGRTIPPLSIAHLLLSQMFLRYGVVPEGWLGDLLEPALLRMSRSFSEDAVTALWERCRAGDAEAKHFILDALCARGFSEPRF